MRQIFLMRHGKSSWEDPAQDDFERPLNGRGRKNTRAMAKAWAAHNWEPGLILCSAALRTRATYDILAPQLPGIPVKVDLSLYEAAWEDLLHSLRQTDDSVNAVMMIGHNPGLERLTAQLCGGRGMPQALSRLDEKFSTGALAVLECDALHWAELGPNTCQLTEFLRPKDLE